jgi:hypothetical protein
VTTVLLPYGDRAWLLDGAADPIGLADRLRPLLPAGIEIVVGARTCLIRSHDSRLDRSLVEEAIAQLPQGHPLTGADAPPIVLRVRYDGDDLAAVAEQTGLDPDDVVALHSGATYRVAFLGFAPGFGYLTGLPEQLRLPRRSVPRVRVPAGAVAIADRYSCACCARWHPCCCRTVDGPAWRPSACRRQAPSTPLLPRSPSGWSGTPPISRRWRSRWAASCCRPIAP